MMHIPPLGYGYGYMEGMPVAFGDTSSEYNQANYAQGFAFDPSTGMYVAYVSPMQYNEMMSGSQHESGLQGDFHKDNVARQLIPETAGGPCDALVGYEATMEDYSQGVNAWMTPPSEHVLGRAEVSRKGRNRNRRDRGERSGRVDHGDRMERVDDVADNGAVVTEAPHGPVNFTTVMFRNIPNKYTREMLVSQLEQDLKGHFDFVYLPIDFKNKCNVGYAFINFRSVEACEAFIGDFNGVEARRCLPGLNSRKVTEVTPARVQGFDDNVQRLRNSPVMRELAYHPEWMPLIFDEFGEMQSFPEPDRPLDPIKPRRRGREEYLTANAASSNA